MNRILFVDDDPDILYINRKAFTAKGFEVMTAPDFENALKAVEHSNFDCIVLDVILPAGEDGYKLCKTIRERTDTPILFLTSLTEQDFLYQGFASGADDYLTKPYDLKELQFRIEALIHRYRGRSNRETIMTYPPLKVNITSRRAEIAGKPMSLTGGEFDILALLCSHPSEVLSPTEIYNQVWKMPDLDATHTVQVHISHLRRKLDTLCPEHKFIQTAWGKGYYFVPFPD